MGKVQRIAACPSLQAAWLELGERLEEYLTWIINVQQIPAPTFHEAKRAHFIASTFVHLGLQDVRRDKLENVYGRIPGLDAPNRKPVIISAHSDTVFPLETDLRTRRVDKKLFGPGIGDNSTGVGGLFACADIMLRRRLRPLSDIWFVSNVGEEGLGDLRGMREVVRHFGRQALYIVVEGGLYGQIAHEATGVRRFRIAVKTPGGHSWGSFGSPSAIHELVHLAAAIDRLSVSEKPKSTFNIGVIEGGTTINSIASQASMLLDLRSESGEQLDMLVGQVKEIVNRAQIRARRRQRTVSFEMVKVGERPAGRIARDAPLVRWAEESLKASGCPEVLYVSGSTDANIPLSQGIPAVCIGLTESANSHRVDEHLNIDFLPGGLRQLLLLALAASDYQPQV
ncbi:MAG: M20/M25/M40 family metallo-hydrolase [Candidatus Promineifilaceae bacterium]